MSDSIYHDGTYSDSNPTWHEEDSGWKAANILKLLERNRVTPANIAEVGCGGGLILKEVAKRYGTATAVGYDVSPQAHARARSRAAANVEFRHLDILATTDHFDVLMAIDVFEHVDDYIGFLRSLRKHATRTVFHIPLDISVQAVARAQPIMYARQRVGHLHYFTKETALATLEYAGYTNKDWFYTYSAIEAPGRSRMSRLISWPRKLALAINEDLAVRFLGGVR
jgi:2-polyprenyl-3-methyl-5-hydroxy-6-metoxy-1,4-benzoquinol methylase